MKENLFNNACFAKSFMMLGDSLEHCYDCSYCRVSCDKNNKESYHLLPTEINSNFDKIPVAVNLFYGDPLLQVENTVKILRRLEKAKHKGPVIIVTKGEFALFPDVPFDLDLHIAFSTFGIDSQYDGGSMERVERNLNQIRKRKNNYRYSIEFRPICYNINDSQKVFERVIGLAKEYNLAIGYSGLQGKPESVAEWKRLGINLNPYPGYSFGHKKLISQEKQDLFAKLAKQNGVAIFKKTSCLFSYVHNLERDYNAHYYRPNEVGCEGCPMEAKCMTFKSNIGDVNFDDVLKYPHKIVEKTNHECILKRKGICNFPTADCSHISGKIIKSDVPLTTSDVRLTKWLTGLTVDADFYESSKISSFWSREYENNK